jgi:hypothetical protein
METSKSRGSIGVQQILPRTGTSWQGQHAAPVQTDNSAGDQDGSSQQERGATPDGMGKLVDKIV